MPATVDIPARYDDPRRAGRGGMGDIWLVRDTELDRDVVIKLLRLDMASDPQVARRFRREARAAAQLSHHPHVVTVYDVGEHDGQPYIVLEYLPGGTVADRLRAGTVTREQALRWIDEAADALDDAHAAGIVHRDVKPGNLLLDASESVRIADFGIARAADHAAVTHTSPGTVLGTAGYLSPEQASGETVGPASDRYSLAVVAWELLSGRRPYERDSFAAEAAAHVHERIPSIRAVAPDLRLPEAVDRVFRRALAKQPGQRFPSAASFARALRDALDEAEAATVPLTERIAVAAPAMTIVDIPRRRLRLLAPILLLLAAGLLLIALNRDDAPNSAADSSARTTEGATPRTAPRATTTQAETLTRDQAIDLHERGFELIQQGRYSEALALEQRALPVLQGVAPYEAYTSYDIGFALLRLGRCAEAVPYLDRSEQLQGSRSEIDAAQAEAAECLQPAKPAGKTKGKHKHDKG
jgi:serine/threonine protein kinase